MWPFRRRTTEPSTEALQAQEEARQARRSAQAGLRNELKRGPEVTRVADSLRSAQLRNHFSEAMEQMIVVRGTPGGTHGTR